MAVFINFGLTGGISFMFEQPSQGYSGAGSRCGADFDEYTRRVLTTSFPYSHMNPSSREIDTLWTGRRFRLFQNKDEYREGTVKSWKQWNTGPFSSTTFFNINVQMEGPPSIGDSIVVEGTRLNNGKQGTILEYYENLDRFKIKFLDSGSITAIKAEYVKPSITTYCVNRMNIDGGGTLEPRDELVSSSPETKDTLISLEWIDAAFPIIDLDEGALKANCPTCRAVEPPHAAYNDDAEEKEEDCPVCMERKPSCRTLNCGHIVCNDCWNKWRNATSGIPISPPTMDQALVQKERQANYKAFNALLPHTCGGTGSKATDKQAKIQRAHQQSKEYGQGLVQMLVEKAEEGEEGLKNYWEKLRTCPVQVFLIAQIANALIENLPIPALEIFLRILPQRSDEIHKAFSKMYVSEQAHCEAFYQQLCCDICNRIGECCEHVENYRGAIPWYERSLVHAKKRSQHDFRVTTKKFRDKSIAQQRCNLGLAQKRAGLLSKALENYDKSLELYNEGGHVRGNRETLLREMKQWTGNSERLTPGC